MNEFQQFCDENNLKIVLSDSLSTMPKGFCYYFDDQYYIILNDKHSFQQLQRTTIHEIIHILEDHFSQPANLVDVCEEEVNDLIEDLYNEFIIDYCYV